MNLRARRAIAADPGDQIEEIGYELVPAEPLSRAIGRLLRKGENPPHRIHLLPVMAAGTRRTATLAVIRNGSDAQSSLVFVIDPVWKGKAAAMATRTHGLTPAEAEVLASFLDGCSLRDIAQARGSSLATIRTQFHSVMEKFGVGTRAQLVRATLGLSQFMADVEPVALVARHPHRRRLQVLRPGGRSVEVGRVRRQMIWNRCA
jgi:DNA-binding CsgD family transcriptional regulator